MRWEADRFELPAHPDTEAELVLAALGGEKAGCVRIAEIWGRHAEDLMMLQVGPRGPADQVTVSWPDVPKPIEDPAHAPMLKLTGPPMATAMAIRLPGRHGPMQSRQMMQAELDKISRRNIDLYSLLALGPAFQLRLAGHIAAAHAQRLSAANRPALGAALSGRFALVAEQWIGIPPDQVTVSLHEDFEVERVHQGRLRVALPAAWLASVWACGLALVGEHLVVAVTRAGWPDAQVLAVRAPGEEAILLDVHGTESPTNAAHWET